MPIFTFKNLPYKYPAPSPQTFGAQCSKIRMNWDLLHFGKLEARYRMHRV